MTFKLDKTLLKSKKKSIKTKDKALFHKYLVELLDVSKDSKVLDLGCGHGNTMIFLVEKIGTKGKVTGVDKDISLLGVAQHLLKKEVATGKVELVEANLDETLPFNDGQFDRIVCHNVLECIEDKVSFINQCHSLLRKGGLLVMSHSDWDSQIFNSSNDFLSRRLTHHYSDTAQDWMRNSDGTIGRKLCTYFYKSKFRKITPEVYTTVNYSFNENDYSYRIAQDIVKVAMSSKKFSEAEIQAWEDDLIDKNNRKEFYYSYLTNIVIAQK